MITNVGSKNKETLPSSYLWDVLVAECMKLPITDTTLSTVYTIIDDLNTKTLMTKYEFYLLPVVTGVVPDNVAPYFRLKSALVQPLKIERTGSKIQARLDTLPPSVQNGTDETFEVYQIRIDDQQSYEHMMGITKLLTMFLIRRDREDACFYFPDDLYSRTNWEALIKMHAEQFPRLEDPKSTDKI